MPPSGKPPTRASTHRSRPRRRPSPPSRRSIEALARVCAPLCEYLVQEPLDGALLSSLRGVAVVPGQTLARPPMGSASRNGGPNPRPSPSLPILLHGDEIECGPLVERTPEGEFRACQYGYLCLRAGRLGVHSPLQLSPDAMHLHWVIPVCQAHPVTGAMILQCARALQVTGPMDVDRIEGLCRRLQAGDAEPGLFEIATGAGLRSRRQAAGEILVDVERRAGILREDGSIDFRQVNFTPTVSAGQLVARRRRSAPAPPLHDLQGNLRVPAEEGEALPLGAGDNIRTGMAGETEEFFATIDGLLRLSEEGVLSVADVLTIHSDVSFDTGNLTFAGEVFVDGSVAGGFTVEAKGPVTITGTVEPGSAVTSKGNITVGAGILGSRTRVAAAGDVRAQFVQEARVTAGGDIRLGSFAYHARLHAGGTVTVVNGSGQRHGSILGGETWALQGIDIRVAGTISGSQTLLVAGLTPAQAKQLDRITRGAETSYEHVLRILRQFGLTRMDVTQIRNLIKASSGPRRKHLATRARQLGQLSQAYQTLLARKQALRDTIARTVEHVRVRVSGTARAGVQVRLGEHHLVLQNDVGSACFHIDDNQLVERQP